MIINYCNIRYNMKMIYRIQLLACAYLAFLLMVWLGPSHCTCVYVYYYVGYVCTYKILTPSLLR